MMYLFHLSNIEREFRYTYFNRNICENGEGMTDTHLRDKISKMAQNNVKDAYIFTKKIEQPWFKAQALAHVARYSNKSDVLKIAKEARQVAYECDDDYKKSSVRAWEIVALAERGFKKESEKALNEAMKLAVAVEPVSSRSEVLFNLFQASCHIDMRIASKLYERMNYLCPTEEHWRAKRAMKNASEVLEGKTMVREYFW